MPLVRVVLPFKTLVIVVVSGVNVNVLSAALPRLKVAVVGLTIGVREFYAQSPEIVTVNVGTSSFGASNLKSVRLPQPVW